MNSSKKIESAFSLHHCSEGNVHSAETQALKRPRFEVKHGFALEDIDMNDAVDEIYALEVMMPGDHGDYTKFFSNTCIHICILSVIGEVQNQDALII